MTDTIVKNPIRVTMKIVKFKIASSEQNEECSALITKLEKSGWDFVRNKHGDVISVQILRDVLTPEDLKRFTNLAPYVKEDSCLAFTPVHGKNSSPIWWFFERGSLRESHWGVEL